jgi:hypothetical protein
MDAVLLLTADSCRRVAKFLLPSLQRHYHDLGTLWVVSPHRDVAAVRREVEGAETGLRHSFLSDEEVVPELVLHQRLGFPRVSGWYRQQLVKLAIVDRISGDFYLTLDDDMFAVTDFGDPDCIAANRALRSQDRAGHRARILPPGSPSNLDDWLTWSAEVLQCAPLDYQPEVTPSIFSCAAVRQLAGWLESNARPAARRWRVSAIASAIVATRGLRTWRGRLLALLPWTEYTLYDTFLVRHGDFVAYHREPTDTLLLGNAVWLVPQFENWRPRASDDSGRRLLFNLVASRSGITVEEVAARLKSAPLQCA